MKRNFLTQEDINTMLSLHSLGKSNSSIHNLMTDRSTGSIEQVLCKYKKYKNHTLNEQVEHRLVDLFKQYELAKDEPVKTVTFDTHIDAVWILSIDEAIEQLKTAIVQFIDSQVSEQKKKEVEALKKEYETKLTDMQTVMIQAKKTSVIDMLKQKWGHL